MQSDWIWILYHLLSFVESYIIHSSYLNISDLYLLYRYRVCGYFACSSGGGGDLVRWV